MSLLDSLRSAQDHNSERKSSFGAHYRDKAEVAAEQAAAVLDRLQVYDEQRLEMDGLLKGARNMVEYARSTVFEGAQACRRDIEEARAERAVTENHLAEAIAELDRRQQSMQEQASRFDEQVRLAEERLIRLAPKIINESKSKSK
jgi:hypothetical protein